MSEAVFDPAGTEMHCTGCQFYDWTMAILPVNNRILKNLSLQTFYSISGPRILRIPNVPKDSQGFSRIPKILRIPRILRKFKIQKMLKVVKLVTMI